MRQKITLYIFAFLIARCHSQDTKCDVTDPGGIIGWSTKVIVVDPIKDSESLDLTFKYTGDLQVDASTDEDGHKYIDITAADSVWSIKTNDYFRDNYEQDQKDKPTATQLQILRTMTITCQDTAYPLTITLYVQDTNNHAPTFLEDTYTYVMPMPLVPKIDLTNFGDTPIIVEDLDFSNTQMTFAVSPPEKFALDFKDLGSRQYQAILKVTEYVRYDEDLQLTITATDGSEPLNTNTAKITIQKDAIYSQPDIPTFSELIYAFSYSIEGNTPSITPDDPSKEITITTSDSDQTTITLSDDTYFTATYDTSTNKVTMAPTHTPVVSSESVMTLTLTVTLGSESSESAILIKLPSEVVITIPTFTEAYYTATYSVDSDGTPSVTLDDGQEIAITQEAAGLDIKLEGDDHFSIQNVGGVWTLNAETALDADVLKKGGNIPLTLHATITEDSEKYEGYGAVIIKLPEVLEVPRFAEANYKGTYKVDSAGVKDTVELTNGPINIIQTDETVDIAILDSTKNFKVIQDTDGWTVDVSANLDSTTLQQGGDIVLTLSAILTNADVDSGSSTLIISLPEPAQTPTFVQPYYTATYKRGTDKDTLEMDQTIEVEPVDGQTVTVTFDENENSAHFSISYDPATHSCAVTLKSDLTDDVLTQGGDIILNIIATVPDATEKGLTALVITLPEAIIPQFSEVYYTAKYTVDENSNGVLRMVGQNITISSPQDQIVDLNFVEVSDYFDLQASADDDHQWTVTVKENLPADILNSGKSQILGLQAQIPGSPTSTIARDTLIIELPDMVETPKFLKAIYNAEYKTTDDGATITLSNGPIELTATENINVVFDDTYSEYFDFTLNADPQITVKKQLEEDIINKYQEVVLTLQVSLDASVETETTVIELKLPHTDVLKTLKFNEPSFIFSYQVNDDTHSIDQKGQTISLTNGESGATVTIMDGTYKDNFKVDKNTDDDTYSINIAKNLVQTVLDSESDILLVLDAALSGNDDGFATVLINLPKKEAGTPPQFTETFYAGSYVLGEESGGSRIDTVTIDGSQINLNDGISEEIDVTLGGTNSDHFEITAKSDNTGYDISVKTNLDSATLIGQTDIVLTVQASNPEVTEVGKATLVIELPKEVTPAAFTQAYYTGTYVVNSDADVVKTDGTIELNGDYLEETEVSLKVPTEFQDKFTLSADSPYVISLESDIDNVYSYNEIVLTLEATLTGTSRTSSATVVIKVPAIPLAPKFTYPIYEFKYDSDKVTSADGKTIATDASDPDLVTITVESPYTSNFGVTYDDTQKGYIFAVTNALDQTTIDQNTEIFVLLDAKVSGSDDVSSTTIAVKMPEKTENVVPKFSDIYYQATYTHNEDPDPDNVVISEKVPITIESDKAGDTKVTVIETYANNFEAILDTTSNSWQLTVVKKLTEPILSGKEIIISLEASLPGAADTGTATVILNLPGQDKKPIPLFDKPSYNVEYSLNDDGTAEITNDPIIVDSTDPKYVDVKLADYTDNFALTPTTDNQQWDLTLTNTPLDSETLKNNAELVITLTASLDNSIADGTAILVVKLPQPSVKFGLPFYSGTYIHDETDSSKDNVEVNITVEPAGATAVIIEGDYKDNFKIDCEAGKCTLSLETPLESTVLTSENEIILVVEASKTDAADTSKATVIIKLPLQDTFKAPAFSETLYVATYNEDDQTGEVTIELDKPITITGETDASLIVLDVEGDYKDVFSFTANGDHWDVTTTGLTSNDLEKVSILFNLKATKSGISVSGLAGLVIQLPKSTDPKILAFTQIAYTASYSVISGDNNDEISIDDGPIEIDGIDDASTVTLEVEDTYKEYIKLSPESDHWTITMTKDFPSDITDQISVLVSLKATIDDRSGEGALVVKLPKKVSSGSFYFEDTVYNTEYEESADNSFTLAFEKNMILKGDTSNVDQVTIEGVYKDNFDVTLANNKVDITVKDALSDEVLALAAITLDIKASLSSDESESTTCTVVIKLPRTVVPATFYFDNTVYTATYNSDTRDITVEQTITIVGDIDNSAVVVSSGDYKDYFTASHDEGTDKVTVTLTKPLESDVVAEKAAITVDIVATRQSDTTISTLVVKLPKQTGEATLFFDKTSYEANYEDGENPTITLDGEISLTGDADRTATFEVQQEYQENFNVSYNIDDKITITLKIPLTSEIIDGNVALSFNIAASTESETANTAIVVKLPKKIVPATFYFTNAHYVADYNSDDIIQVKDISLEGQTEGVQFSLLDGEYSDHFTVNQTDSRAIISLTEPLEDEIVNKESAISLDLTATKGDEIAAVTVVIKLPKTGGGDTDDGDSSEDKTGLIAAVAVLAVLLVASLVGSAVFYYFKFRRGNSYNDIDEGRPSERFRKNSTTDSKLKIEHPTRRATGVIKYPLEEAADGETTTDGEPDLERRKSVQFDTINIDELEIEKSVDDDNDVDDMIFDSDTDESEARRTSRV